MRIGATVAVLAIMTAGIPASVRAQQTGTPAGAETGCVMRTEAGDYTLARNGTCSVLMGRKVEPSLVGHLVTLRGAVQEATGSNPRTITPTTIMSVGGSCSLSCSPHPPGHRGLGHEKPGSEGGTPGATSTPRPQ